MRRRLGYYTSSYHRKRFFNFKEGNMKTTFENFKKLLSERILVIDGAMGTMIQRHKLTEKDFRGERFKD